MKTNTSLLYVILFSLTFLESTSAQISISGLADFELRLSGEDSSPYVNQTPGDGLSLYTPNIRLFMSGNISDQWFVSSVLQADHYEGKKLSQPFFSVININWSPNFDSDLVITAGRFVNPYGSYASRFLSNTNPFVHLPLSHSAGLPISKKYGHINAVDYNSSNLALKYGEQEMGMTVVYQRMYSQGIKFSNSFGESNWLTIDLAATHAPAASHFDFAEYDTPAWIGRMLIKPAVWLELGLSYSKGAFLLNDATNDSLRIYDASGYPQSSLGADLTFNYRYYTLLVEWNQGFFKAPFYNPVTSNSDSPRTGKATIDHFSTEFIYDFPFLVGGYFALRYEQMLEGELELYRRNVNKEKIDQTFTPWTYDRQRFEFVAGYKLHRNVLLKASYLLSEDDGPDLEDNVISIQLSVLF